VSGLPWLKPDETKILPITQLAGNILCKRHNEALSPLDAMAGRFFTALKEMHDDAWNKKDSFAKAKMVSVQRRRIGAVVAENCVGFIRIWKYGSQSDKTY
jgi:ribosome biogenesis protein Tsr3